MISNWSLPSCSWPNLPRIGTHGKVKEAPAPTASKLWLSASSSDISTKPMSASPRCDFTNELTGYRYFGVSERGKGKVGTGSKPFLGYKNVKRDRSRTPLLRGKKSTGAILSLGCRKRRCEERVLQSHVAVEH